MSAKAVLTVYGRSGCHLCDEMLTALEPWISTERVSVCVIDVDTAPELARRYGERVPVLEGGGGEEICHYFLDVHALACYLDTV